MRVRHTSLIIAVGFGAVTVAAMASCQQDDPGNLLTTNATDMMTTVGGSGGTSTDGGGGAGADGGTSSQGGATAAGGQGGQGGDPEPVINGCTRSAATDMTAGANPINVNLPGGPYCVVVAQSATFTFTIPAMGASRWMGGTVNPDTGTKLPDPQSPIYACDNVSPYENCPTVSNPVISFPLVGVYPWYDDFAPATIRGVVYVE